MQYTPTIIEIPKLTAFPEHPENYIGHKKNYVLCRKNYIGRRKNYIRSFFALYKPLKNKNLYPSHQIHVNLRKSASCIFLAMSRAIGHGMGFTDYR